MKRSLSAVLTLLLLGVLVFPSGAAVSAGLVDPEGWLDLGLPEGKFESWLWKGV